MSGPRLSACEESAINARGTVPEPTLFWHDYETSGADPRRDRPLQFAGLRTNLDLDPVDEPVVFWCKPARDTLPHPVATLLTGIAPQDAEARGVDELRFAGLVEEQLARPGTCGVGYNSIRFDDEVTRHLLYRNLFEPYAREWRNGNSRWDIIDLARLAYALRPDGLEWPEREPGVPSFRLGDLAAANRLEHAEAHDAASDVRATLALARRLRAAQPRLYAHYFSLRDKRAAGALLDWTRVEPVVHASGRYAAKRRGGITIVAPIVALDDGGREIVVFDLTDDPIQLIDLEADEIRDRIFTPRSDLPTEEARIGLKTVKVNRSPALAPMSVLRDEDCRRIGIDRDRVLANLAIVRGAIAELRPKIRQALTRAPYPPADADLALYENFVGNDTLALLAKARAAIGAAGSASETERTGETARFRDTRYTELCFRARARSFPETLDFAERQRWQQHRERRLIGADDTTTLKLDTGRQMIAELRSTRPAGADQALLDKLERWYEVLVEDLPRR